MNKDIEVLEYEKKLLSKELNNLDQLKIKITKEISGLDKSIRDIKILKMKENHGAIVVSDHALIRFLERKIFNKDVLEGARQKLINDVKDKIGNSSFINRKSPIKINLGYGTAVVKDSKIVTIL